MPTAADLTVKKYDNATNQVWTLQAPSSGDKGTPAFWKNNSITGTVGQKPTFSVSSRSSGQNGESRRVDFKMTYPSVYTETNTGLTKIRSTCVASGSIVVPQDMLYADIQEACAQFGHLLGVQLVVDSMVAGFAPT